MARGRADVHERVGYFVSILLPLIARNNRGGGGSASYWNPSAQGLGFVLSNSNKTVTATGNGWNIGLGVTSRSSGKWYFEIHVDAIGTNYLVGLGDSSVSLSGTYLGSDIHGWSLEQNGTLLHNGVVGSVAATYTTGDVVGVAVDLGTGNLWFSVNGTWVQGNPATGTSPVMTTATGTLFPGISLYFSGGKGTLRVQNSEFSNPAPSGFSSWSGL